MSYRVSVRFVGLATVLYTAATLQGEDQLPRPSPPAQVPTEDFDKTYRLEFKLIATEFDQSYVAITSQSDFAIRYGARKQGSEYGVDVAGTLSILEKGDRLRVRFKVAVDNSDETGDGFDMSNTGSVIVVLGKSRTVGRYGEYELKLTATVDQGASVDEASDIQAEAKESDSEP